jgi:hypothetical protein
LRKPFESNQERVINVSKDRILRDDMINLSQFDDISLLQSFHGEEITRLFVLGKKDAAK